MTANSQLISTAEGIVELARALKADAKVAPKIAIDTEFIRENTFYPIVEIIQVATASDAWLVDARAFKKAYKPGPQGGYDPGIEPLLEVFRDPSVLKVMHAAQGDQECLFTSFATVAVPSIDTAVAASLCGYGEGIGLGKMLKSVMDVEVKKGHARTNWSVRPLPSQLAEYALADVEFLVAAAEKLLTQLERDGRREWALKLSAKWEDPKLYDTDAEGLARKLARGGRLDRRGYAALTELVKWRETRVRQLNLPRRWVADDAVLIDLAQVRPKDLEHLGAFRGLNKGEIRNSGEAILAALKHASEIPEKEVTAPPKAPRHAAPTAEESQVMDLLKCYVGILSDRHRVSARHLMTVDHLLPLLRAKAATREDLVNSDVLSEEAARLIGDELIAFLRGERALGFEKGKVKVFDRGAQAQW